jgi:predicted DCC family thiol-disulfide oxidoreductase YuxK
MNPLGTSPATPFEVEVFFDGDCPLCRREIAFLRKRDRQGRIQFTDIAEPGFDPESVGRTRRELMARIHGRLPDGTWIEGVEVFRRLYTAVGLKPLVAVSRLPGVSHAAEAAYELFARHRLTLTGRRGVVCDGQSCALHGGRQVGERV